MPGNSTVFRGKRGRTRVAAILELANRWPDDDFLNHHPRRQGGDKDESRPEILRLNHQRVSACWWRVGPLVHDRRGDLARTHARRPDSVSPLLEVESSGQRHYSMLRRRI